MCDCRAFSGTGVPGQGKSLRLADTVGLDVYEPFLGEDGEPFCQWNEAFVIDEICLQFSDPLCRLGDQIISHR